MVQRSIFIAQSLAKNLRSGDSQRYKVNLKTDRVAIVESASNKAISRSIDLSNYYKAVVKSKACVSYTDYDSNLVLRAVARYISSRFRVIAADRTRIIQDVAEGLMDTTPMHVIRLDLKSFYETIPYVSVRDRLLYDTSIPRAVRHYLSLFFSQHCSSEQGLPRGVGLTAVLVELVMEKFDRDVRSIEGVYRYFRYSDDILIFVYGDPAQIKRAVASMLPNGMSLNTDKESVTSFSSPVKAVANDVSFEYLGYKFSGSPNSGGRDPREVQVTLSPRKLKRLKSRIITLLKDFEKNRNVRLLIDRIAFITTNHRVNRRGISSYKHSPYVMAGIYYNYPNCGKYEKGTFSNFPPLELRYLDNFLHGLLWGRGSRFASIKSIVDKSQKAELKKMSFYNGYEKRIALRVDYDYLTLLKSVWRNV